MKFFVITTMAANCNTEIEARRYAATLAESGKKAWVVTPVCSAQAGAVFTEEENK